MKPRRRLLSVSAALPVVLTHACYPGQPGLGENDRPLTTEADIRIGEVHAGDAVFGTVTQVRSTSDGMRVFVLEPYISRLSVWTPDGSLLMEVGGRGEGPGEFTVPYRVHIDSGGFYVRDQRRFTRFAADGGLLATIPDPPSTLSFRGFRLRPESLLADGSILAVPVIPPTWRLAGAETTLSTAYLSCMYAKHWMSGRLTRSWC